MRYDSDHKAVTRRRILDETAVELRRHGPTGLSIARVMKQAGLTHGGFYFHFASKDALVAQAIDHMFTVRREVLPTVERDPRAALDRIVAAYLSRTHRDHPEAGCPIPILAGEESRLPAAARDALRAGAERMTAIIADHLAQIGSDDPRGRARLAVAQMVGAIATARMITDAAESEGLLRNARGTVRATLGLPPRDTRP